MNRDCDAARGAMPEALSGEMRAADLEWLESHLADCPPCDAEMDRHRTALRLLGEDDVPDPGPAYWAAFTGRLRRRIAASGAAGKRSRFRLALAATVVLAAGLALFAAGRILRGPVTISGPAGTGTRATGTRATDGSIEADEGAEARLRALVDAAPPGAGGRMAGAPPGDEPGGAPPTPEEIREAMEQLMIVRLKKTLQLSPEQEPRVIPKIQDLMDLRRERTVQRRTAIRRLGGLLRDDGADDAEIGRVLRDLQTLDREMRGREETLRASIGADLTPRQQARLMFFEDRFRRVMQRRLQEALRPRAGDRPFVEPGRRREGPPPRGPGPGGPPPAWEDDFDDDVGDLPGEGP